MQYMQEKMVKEHEGREYWIQYGLIGPRGAMSLSFSNYNGDWESVDLSIHSPKRLYPGDWHTPIKDCHLLREMDCWCDGTSIPRVDHLWGDEDAIYSFLTEEYECRFGTEMK